MKKKSLLDRPLLVHGTFIGLLVILLGALVYLNSAATRLQDQAPADQPLVYGTVPDFALTSQNGETVTREKLKGKYTLANFIFTRCPGPCATLSRNFSAFQKALAGRDDIQLLTVSVDPEFDQPDVLTAYARDYKAEPGRWLFLTGDRTPVYNLIRNGFKVVASENEDPHAAPQDLFIHTTKVVLVDPEGSIRGFYDGTDEEAYKAVLSDIGRMQ